MAGQPTSVFAVAQGIVPVAGEPEQDSGGYGENPGYRATLNCQAGDAGKNEELAPEAGEQPSEQPEGEQPSERAGAEFGDVIHSPGG